MDTATNDRDEFDVFLCHNSADKPAVKEVGDQLKQQGIKPWLDEWELRPGLRWRPEVERLVHNTKSAAVFVGKTGIGPWQDEEIDALLQKFVESKRPVIPVLLPDCGKEPDIPLFLSNRTWVDFRKTDPDPLDQLVWGITGQRQSKKSSVESHEVRSPLELPTLKGWKRSTRLVEVWDSLGNRNLNSWAKDTGGDWSHPKLTTIRVGQTVTLSADAIRSDSDDTLFRFSVQGPSQSCTVRQDWSTNSTWTWNVTENDIGRNIVVTISTKRPKQHYPFGDMDDYTYAVYDVLSVDD